MKRINAGSFWSFFSESTAPGLSDVYDGMMVCSTCSYCMNKNYQSLQEKGVLTICIETEEHNSHQHTFEPVDVFTKLYERYESEGRAIKTMPARRVQEAIFDVQRESGTPYICYKDHVNRQTNQQNIGTIKSSNLCVAPEMMILTDKGQFSIVSLAGKRVNIWNGESFSEVVPTQTGINQKLIRVNLSNGTYIDCTEQHEFYIIKNYQSKKLQKVEAQNLQPNQKLIKYNLPSADFVIGNADIGDNFKYAYTHGLFCADGTYENNTEEKRQLDKYLDKRIPTKDEADRSNSLTN